MDPLAGVVGRRIPGLGQPKEGEWGYRKERHTPGQGQRALSKVGGDKHSLGQRYCQNHDPKN